MTKTIHLKPVSIDVQFKKLLHELLLVVLGTLVTFCSLFYLFLFIPTLVFRPIVKFIAQHIRPDLDSIVSCTGSMLCQVDDNDYQKSVIVIQVEAKGNISYENLLDIFYSRIIQNRLPDGSLRYSELQKYITNFGGYKFWKWDSNFSIRNHIKLFEKNNSRDSSETQILHDLGNKLLNIPFSKNRSPWDVTLMPGITCEDKSKGTALFLRFHHAMVDGYSILYLFQRLFNDDDKPPTPPIKAKFSSITLSYFIRIPFQILRLLGEFLYNTMSSFIWKIPEKQKSKTYHYSVGKAISVKAIKEIREAYGVSFSSIVFALWTGGVRRFLMKQKSISIPESMPCIMTVPLKNHPDKLINKFSFTLASVPTGESDPLQRLKKISDEFESMRNSPIPLIGYWIFLLHGCNFNFIGSRLNSYKYSPTLASYFPIGNILDTQHWELDGCDISEVIFYLRFHQGETGLTFCISSYRGSIRIIPVANAALLSKEEVDELSILIDDEIHALTSSFENFEPENKEKENLKKDSLLLRRIPNSYSKE